MSYYLDEILQSQSTFVIEHSVRTAGFMDIMVKEAGIVCLNGLNAAEVRRAAHLGALYHDIGKVGISRFILEKQSGLSGIEKSILRWHPSYAAQIIEEALDFQTEPSEFRKTVVEIAQYHHERFDGTGYPFGLSGGEIPILARVCAVCDAFDALTHQRPYNRPRAFAEAAEIICAGSGTQFCPEVVRAFERAKYKLHHTCRDGGITAKPGGNAYEMSLMCTR